MFEWLIVGGGIQGCTLATYLLKSERTKVQHLAIIDPHDQPLFKWVQNTSILEMPYLRSPSIHHLDVNPFSLEKFAKGKGRFFAHFTPPYDRPSLELFNEHCRYLMDETDLSSSWIQGRVTGLQRINKGWSVHLSNGEQIESKKVVLAMGLSEHPMWPDWAKEIHINGGQIHHVFDPPACDFSGLARPIIVIGGGISAAHASIRLSRLFPGEVTLLTRHSLRVHQFDSDPAWLGPKNMSPFRLIQDYNERRGVIQNARYRGSMPAELRTALTAAQKDGKLSIYIDEVANALVDQGKTTLQLRNYPDVTAGTVMLATGFHAKPPGIEWLKPLIENQGLRCADCGYPIINPETLEWAPNLFVIGALAELEIGPVARNIAGARRGAERILKAR